MEDRLKSFLESLTNEQKAELMSIIDKDYVKTGYERPEEGEFYWVISEDKAHSVEKYAKWIGDHTDNEYYGNANVYTLRGVAEADARADLLMRRLRRFTKLNNKEKLDWNDENQPKYHIVYTAEDEVVASKNYCLRNAGDVYFDSIELAERAIDEFKDELEWYFTDYLQNW